MPTRQTCRSEISVSLSAPRSAITLLISSTTGSSISRSSSTVQVSASEPSAHSATTTAPTRPIVGSSQDQPNSYPPASATMAAIEVAASATTCT